MTFEKNILNPAQHVYTSIHSPPPKKIYEHVRIPGTEHRQSFITYIIRTHHYTIGSRFVLELLNLALKSSFSLPHPRAINTACLGQTIDSHGSSWSTCARRDRSLPDLYDLSSCCRVGAAQNLHDLIIRDMLPVAVDLYHTCQMLLGVACGSRKTCMIEDLFHWLDLYYTAPVQRLISAG